MSWIPGWDSINGAHFWSNLFFWGSIVALILLGISEVISHRYSERKDELSAQQQTEAENQHDEEMRRLQVDLANAARDTAQANQRAAELNLALQREIAARQPRTINADDRAKIIARLATDTAPKGQVVVIWKLFDEEAIQFGRQIISLLRDSGFDAVEGHGPMTFETPGQWIVVRDLATLQAAPNAIGAMQAAFRDVLHLDFNGVQRKDPFPDLGEVVIAIGAKG